MPLRVALCEGREKYRNGLFAFMLEEGLYWSIAFLPKILLNSNH